MQDEIIKHTGKIIKTAKEEKSFWHKFKEILTEILIIVFAVSISIWFHNLSEKHHQREEAKEFLTDLKSDLNQDIQNMKKYKKGLDAFSGEVEKLNAENFKNFVQYPEFNIINRKTAVADYEGFKSSGKISYIENKKLKSSILKYYQEDISAVEDGEKLYNKFIADFGWETMANGAVYPSKLNDKDKMKVATRLLLLGGFSKQLSKSYDMFISSAQNIIKEIDKDIEE